MLFILIVTSHLTLVRKIRQKEIQKDSYNVKI